MWFAPVRLIRATKDFIATIAKSLQYSLLNMKHYRKKGYLVRLQNQTGKESELLLLEAQCIAGPG